MLDKYYPQLVSRADQQLVTFHKQSIYNKALSEQSGKAVFEEFDFVRVQHPGERDYTNRKVTPQDRVRWADKWNAYVAQKDQVINGTPIELLFPKNPASVANIMGAGFFTIEQLAEASSHGMVSLGMSGQDYINSAQRYLEHAKRGVAYHEMQQALEARDQEMQLLKQEIEDLKRQLTHVINTSVAQVTPIKPAQPALPQHKSNKSRKKL